MAKEGYSREKGSPPINREGGLSMRAHTSSMLGGSSGVDVEVVVV